MSVIRLAVLATVSLAAGAAVGATVTRNPVAPAALERIEKPIEERLPVEAPMRTAKQARLDIGCDRHAWPYIPAHCLERVAAARLGTTEPTVTIARRDAEARTTTLVKVPVLHTASR